MEQQGNGEEYVFLPGTHEFVASNGTRVTIHAGAGVTKKQFEPVVRMYVAFREENEREKQQGSGHSLQKAGASNT